jgi:hypothetical protein
MKRALTHIQGGGSAKAFRDDYANDFQCIKAR